MPELSRSRIQKAIKDSCLKLNNEIINDSSHKVKENDIVELVLIPETVSFMEAADIALDIVYEDDDLVVLNKQAGLTVHPGAGNHNDTLANALLKHFGDLSDVGGTTRPGIVHRLDKDTSGLMVVAKNNFAHMHLAAQIEKRELIRRYKALVWGRPNPTSGIINTQFGRSNTDRKKMTVLKFGGKVAITHYQTLQILLAGLASLVECKLDTGRTHQIRVHLSHIGNSIIGDQTYGHNARKLANKAISAEVKSLIERFGRQALHSFYIAFHQPRTGKFLEFEIGLPADMEELLIPNSSQK